MQTEYTHSVYQPATVLKCSCLIFPRFEWAVNLLDISTFHMSVAQSSADLDYTRFQFIREVFLVATVNSCIYFKVCLVFYPSQCFRLETLQNPCFHTYGKPRRT